MTRDKLFSIPVLLIIFNKPEKTRQVLQSLSEVRPKYIYILCDGARDWIDGESDLISHSKQVVEGINWDCKIHYKYFTQNLGVIETFSNGLNWFFENNEMGIILESDCLPGTDFFYFCEELLLFYKNDERIWHISGDNHQRGKIRGEGSYYFSTIPHIWGWATWKRAWCHYDPKMSDYVGVIRTEEFKNSFFSQKQYTVWCKLFDMTAKGEIQTWDYQWTYALMKNKAYAIIPNVNLVSNIGFGADALNTKDRFSPFANRPIEKLGEIVHPAEVTPDHDAITYTFYHNICGKRSFKSLRIKAYYYFANRIRYFYNWLFNGPISNSEL